MKIQTDWCNVWLNRLAGIMQRHGRVRQGLKAFHRLLPRRIGDTLAQWVLASVHEPDFHLFERVRHERGLLLDVGANRGHAAISVLRHTSRLRVVSLEPNPAMRWSLCLIRLLHPLRFRFHLIGAGAQSSVEKLWIPLAENDLSSQASLDPKEFDKSYVRERLAGQGHAGQGGVFHQISVPVRRVDELGYRPDVVKIDVEGWEEQVLAGMPALLDDSRPLLIIERNNHGRWAPALARLGYRFYSYSDQGLQHHPNWADVPSLNVVCCHPGSRSAIARTMCAPGSP